MVKIVFSSVLNLCHIILQGNTKKKCTSKLSHMFQRLYDLGARKVLVTGTGPLGCVPAELAMRSGNGQCAPELQRAAALFNPQLVEMINGLNSEYGDNIFIAANTNAQTNDFISNPGAFGKQI